MLEPLVRRGRAYLGHGLLQKLRALTDKELRAFIFTFDERGFWAARRCLLDLLPDRRDPAEMAMHPADEDSKGDDHGEQRDR